MATSNSTDSTSLASGASTGFSAFLKRRGREVVGGALLSLAFLLAAALITHEPTDPSLNTIGTGDVKNLLGHPGADVQAAPDALRSRHLEALREVVGQAQARIPDRLALLQREEVLTALVAVEPAQDLPIERLLPLQERRSKSLRTHAGTLPAAASDP